MSIYALVTVVLFTICTSALTDSERDGQALSLDPDPNMPQNQNRRQKRNVVPYLNSRWPDTEIEYKISERDFDREGRATLAAAFKHIEARTCVRFVPRPRDSRAPYIYVGRDEQFPESCVSAVGYNRTMDKQLVGIGPDCLSMGIVVHEIMHRLGFYHEHNRYDRHHFVRVINKNILANTSLNFEQSYYTDTLGLPYDYHSVMHYKTREFSKNNKPTIVPRPDGRKYLIGQRLGMSDLDAKKINVLFNCTKEGSRYLEGLKKALIKLRKKKLPNMSELELKDCPENLVSDTQCRAWLSQGYCGEQQIAAGCPRVCGRTTSCRKWAKYGYCKNEHKKQLMKLICHCACSG